MLRFSSFPNYAQECTIQSHESCFSLSQGGEKGWRDMGTGNLTISADIGEEGSRTGESSEKCPPQVIFRTETGKALLNARLYKGLGASLTKDKVTLILFSSVGPPFHLHSTPILISHSFPLWVQILMFFSNQHEGDGGESKKTTYCFKTGSVEKGKELRDKLLELVKLVP